MRRPPNFNGLARFYRVLEVATFGPWLWRCRCAFLDELRTRRNAAVLGDGDGRFTARLLEVSPLVLVDAVDASLEMLRALVQNAGHRSGRVRIHLADVREWEPHSLQYDLIVTHFLLDSLTTAEVTALARRLRENVTPGAIWVLSEFAIPEGWYGWLVARPVVQALYLAFLVLTGLRVQRLPDYRTALEEAGFERARKQEFLGGLLASELWTPRER